MTDKYSATNLKSYPTYKDSGATWIREIPEHWKITGVKREYEIQMGKMLQPQAKAEGDVQVPYLKALNVQWYSVHTGKDQNMWATQEEIGQLEVLPGDLLVCEGGEGGRAGIVISIPKGFIIQNALHRVRSRGKSQNQFLQHMMKVISDSGWFEAINSKATIAHFTKEKFEALQIPVPPPDEQAAIVRYLDEASQQIQTYISARERLIALLEEQRQAIIHQAVTRGLDPNVRLKPSGVEWLGDVPEHWEIERLSTSLESQINGVWGSDPDGTDDLPCIRVADFDRKNHRIRTDKLTLRSVKPSERHGRILRKGDLLLEKSGGGEQQPVGTVMLYDHDFQAVCSNFVGRIVLREGYEPTYQTYLHATLYAIGVNKRSIKQTTGIQNIDSSSYLSELVGVPPPEEQAAIIEHLEKETTNIDNAIDRSRRQIELMQEYRTRLIADVVTGKLDVREAAEELPQPEPA